MDLAQQSQSSVIDLADFSRINVSKYVIYVMITKRKYLYFKENSIYRIFKRIFHLDYSTQALVIKDLTVNYILKNVTKKPPKPGNF